VHHNRDKIMKLLVGFLRKFKTISML